MLTPAAARQIATDVLSNALTGVVGAIEREAARQRSEACTERLFHLILAREGRRIWRPWHRFKARRLDARCRANASRCNVSAVVRVEAHRRGLV